MVKEVMIFIGVVLMLLSIIIPIIYVFKSESTSVEGVIGKATILLLVLFLFGFIFANIGTDNLLIEQLNKI